MYIVQVQDPPPAPAAIPWVHSYLSKGTSYSNFSRWDRAVNFLKMGSCRSLNRSYEPRITLS